MIQIQIRNAHVRSGDGRDGRQARSRIRKVRNCCNAHGRHDGTKSGECIGTLFAVEYYFIFALKTLIDIVQETVVKLRDLQRADDGPEFLEMLAVESVA